jgi:hypothetical protein
MPAQNQNQQIVARNGTLPKYGRLIIRSGLAWMDETSQLFVLLTRELTQVLTAQGFDVIATSPSRLEKLPSGTEEMRNVKVPAAPGGGGRRGQRVMSVPEAITRMNAMHLAREGRLPRLSHANAASTARPTQAVRSGEEAGVLVMGVPLTKPELIRFALTQEAGHPALRGHADIPGRLPHELWETDPDKADYALVVKFAMLWPSAQQKDKSAIVAGWHLLSLDCYDLAPARSGKDPRRVWNATVQRVVSDPNLPQTLPDMARAALL